MSKLHIVFLVSFACLIFSCQSKKEEKATVGTSLTKQELDIELQGFGAPYTNLNQLNDKPVFLNFWATWCPPCRKEMPSIQKLYGKFGDKVNFVLISMKEPSQDHQKFVKENQYTFPVYEAKSLINKKLMPKVFPTTFIIAPTGEIIYELQGSRDWDKKDIQDLLDKYSSN